MSFVQEELTWSNKTQVSIRYIKPLDLPSEVLVEDLDTLNILV